MTPTQLRAYAAVVRLGSVKAAASELRVTQSAVSLLIGQLRRELGDQLFSRTASGLAFTPGGLRLASRAGEILGLQDQTVREVSQAADGRRMLRLAASSLFAEHAAPGLIELFANRANDLDVELSVRSSKHFPALLMTRAIDVTIGTADGFASPADSEALTVKPFLNYTFVVVAGPEHPLANRRPSLPQLRDQMWLLGPSAADENGVIPRLIRQLGIPEEQQRIFQSDAAALEETKRSQGISLALKFSVAADVANHRFTQIDVPGLRATGTWSATTLAGQGRLPAVDELLRFITTPRAMQAMLRGSGVNIGRFKPSVYVTLWS